jgi:hypothetical protein
MMSQSDDRRVLERDAEPDTLDDEPALHTDDLAGSRADDSRAAKPEQNDDADERLALVDDADRYRARWDTIQTSFVDQPRQAVEQADTLVAEVIRELVDAFSEERRGLEGQWSAGEEVSTEDLRMALKRYRSFFQRLLTH